MKKKVFYFGIFMVLTLSASMLALSYSKESGYNASVPNNAYEDLNVVFSDYEFHSDDDISFTVANNIDKEKEYSIKLELNGALGDVYYILDNGDEKALMDEIIYVGKLNAYGNNSDVASHNLKVYSKSGAKFEYNISVTESIINSLYSKIVNDSNVYLKGDTYYFYGDNVNNYIMYEGELHRIVKMDSSNVTIINDTRTIASFDPAASFLNVYDYLATFNDDVSTSSVGARTNWLNNGFSYWLSGDANSDRYVVLNVGGLKVDNFGKKYFYRTTKTISKDLNVVLGDGSINNPYGV